MRQKKHRLEMFSLYNGSGVEKHLEEQAAKGWMLEKIGLIRWTYRRAESQALKFNVTYFPEAGHFDPQMQEGQQTYVEMCEAAGWEMIAQRWQMQVFCHKDLNAVSIETDPVTQVANIKAAMARFFLLIHTYWILTAIGQMARDVLLLPEGGVIALLADGVLLWGMMLSLTLGLRSAMDLITYFRWIRRAEQVARQEDRFLPPPDIRRLKKGILSLNLITTALLFHYLWSIGYFWVELIGFTLLVLAFPLVDRAIEAMKACNYGKEENYFLADLLYVVIVLVSVAGIPSLLLRFGPEGLVPSRPETYYTSLGWEQEVYHHELPLQMSELQDVDDDWYSRELASRSTWFVSTLEGSQTPDWRREDADTLPAINYRIVEGRGSAIQSLVREQLLEEYAGTEKVDAETQALWEAENAWEMPVYEKDTRAYLIDWGDRILYIYFEWEPMPMQIQTVVEQLKTY